jgi:putative oxygen-independent coproporphyrinogen III oxidase
VSGRDERIDAAAVSPLPPLALYVHFPWCVSKCPYCDFNSYALGEVLPERRYIDALIEDLQAQAASAAGRELVSVFLGGGTPSLFSAEAVARVLAAARGCIGLAAACEVTLEANPGTIERGRFAEYRAAGVTRVSLGAQSFDAATLGRLGRIHSPQETCRAAAELHTAGLENFNLDLMYALPGQDLPGALADVAQALALSPAHISHYQLTIEPGTVFAGVPPADLPADEVAAGMLEGCAERLGQLGFEQYEVSAYALPGRAARHNCNYWTFGDYLGVGAGAHGKLSSHDGHIVRTTQPREPRRYLAAAGRALSVRPVRACDLPFEFMMNALRLTAGFSPRLYESRTGLRWDGIVPTLEELRRKGLMRCAGEHWMATPLGARFLNDLLLPFLPEASATAGRPVSTATGR